MNKVLQAAGRVIRTQKDRGIILLLDERFCQRENLSLFPEEWSNYQVSKIASVEKQLKNFGQERNEEMEYFVSYS